MERERLVSSLIVALAGLFYIFAPHELHIALQTDFGLSHGIHIAIGIFLVGIAIYYARMKPEQKKIRRRPRKAKHKAKKAKRRRRRR